MGFKYLDNKKWSQITRDERTFCADLYYHLKYENKVKEFTAALIKKTGLDNIQISDEIEMGFEVAYYRDLLFHYELSNEFRLANKRDIQGLLKRTFDLCIFLPNDIIIIEAKAAESLSNKQMIEFIYDAKSIEAMHKELGLPKVNVHLVGLVSHEYAPSEQTRDTFKNKIISWKDIEGFDVDYQMTEALSTVYSKTAKVRSSKKIVEHNVIQEMEATDIERRIKLFNHLK